MTQSVAEKLEQGPMFDEVIVEHHFTLYARDYDIIVETYSFVSGEHPSYLEGRYRYRFSHCVLSEVTTAIPDESWRISWDDVYINYEKYQALQPEGYCWDVCYVIAYPGLTYIENSLLAQSWSERLGQPMHEVYIETNAQNIRLVFHDVSIVKVAQGYPDIAGLVPIVNEDGTGAV